MSGVGRTDAEEGLTRLDSSSLAAGFFLLYNKEINKGAPTMK
jgi:hypothetical protein